MFFVEGMKAPCNKHLLQVVNIPAVHCFCRTGGKPFACYIVEESFFNLRNMSAVSGQQIFLGHAWEGLQHICDYWYLKSVFCKKILGLTAGPVSSLQCISDRHLRVAFGCHL